VPGRSVAFADTIAGCKAILAGECDEWQESSLYMVGTIDEAREKEKASHATAQPAPAQPKQAAAAQIATLFISLWRRRAKSSSTAAMSRRCGRSMSGVWTPLTAT
jgi:hypothetical protein